MDSAVSLRGLSKKYGDFLALDNVSLEVGEGELFALLGPNGAGKTTLMRVLTTQLESSGGQSFIFGKNVASEAGEVKKLIGYVPQEMSVWTDITGYENLLIYSKIYGLPEKGRRETIMESLAGMGLENVADKMVNAYSGGMIRKLEIASAMMLNPKILFLDEPTIGLDPGAREAVWGKLKRLNKENGMSVFFTTHYMDEADSCADNVAIISNGKIMKTGSPQELKRSVGNECVKLELGAVPDAKDISELKEIAGVLDARAGGEFLEIYVKDAGMALNPIMALMIKRKNSVKNVSITKPTLDDVFLKYAGAEMPQNGNIAGMDEVKKTRKRIMG